MQSKILNLTARAALGGALLALSATVSAQDSQAPDTTEEVSAADETASEEATKEAKPEKITDRMHPDYVRCRTERKMGSLAQRRKRCMTNREWKMVGTEGNKRANELVDEMRANATNGN